MPPDFLVIGHVVQDLLPGGWRLGGTASFASLQAARLGLRAAVLTSARPDLNLSTLLPGIDVVCLPAKATTQFENIYDGPRRTQYVPSRGPSLSAEALPAPWRQADIVLLGPVAGEVDADLAHCFPKALLGISAQGWLRQVGPDSRVRALPPRAWDPAPLLRQAAALFLADEDLPSGEAAEALAAWSALTPILAFTRGDRGADICYGGHWRHIDAFSVATADPTGAGDIFAAAFLIRLHETDDVWDAARFATGAASFVVQAEGTAGIPDREQIEGRLAQYPDIILR